MGVFAAARLSKALIIPPPPIFGVLRVPPNAPPQKNPNNHPLFFSAGGQPNVGIGIWPAAPVATGFVPTPRPRKSGSTPPPPCVCPVPPPPNPQKPRSTPGPVKHSSGTAWFLGSPSAEGLGTSGTPARVQRAPSKVWGGGVTLPHPPLTHPPPKIRRRSGHRLRPLRSLPVNNKPERRFIYKVGKSIKKQIKGGGGGLEGARGGFGGAGGVGVQMHTGVCKGATRAQFARVRWGLHGAGGGHFARAPGPLCVQGGVCSARAMFTRAR